VASRTGPTAPTRRRGRAPPPPTPPSSATTTSFHRVESIGGPGDDRVAGLTLDSRLEADGRTGWRVVDGERELGAYRNDQLRISVSWKAQVFADADAARVYDEHADDLGFDAVLARFCDDFAARGTPLAIPADPLPDFVRTPGRVSRRADRRTHRFARRPA
jgi:hypothetical protein